MADEPTGGDEQEVDIGEVDLQSTPSQIPGERRRTAPPPLPPSASMNPSAPPPEHAASHPPAPPGGSVHPSMAPSMAPPEPAGRGPAFYGVILLVLFVVTIAAGAIVAFTRSKSATAAAPTASTAPASPTDTASAVAQPNVINIPVVDMNDDDAGAP